MIKYIYVGTVLESQKLNIPIFLDSFFSLGIIIKHKLNMAGGGEGGVRGNHEQIKTVGKFLPHEIHISKGWGIPVFQELQSLLMKTPCMPCTEYDVYVMAVNTAGLISTNWISRQTGEHILIFFQAIEKLKSSDTAFPITFQKAAKVELTSWNFMFPHFSDLKYWKARRFIKIEQFIKEGGGKSLF